MSDMKGKPNCYAVCYETSVIHTGSLKKMARLWDDGRYGRTLHPVYIGPAIKPEKAKEVTEPPTEPTDSE